VVVVIWLVIIFFSFSLLAPPNATATLALMVSALAVAGAIFLILEMDRPFTGVVRISSEPMQNALKPITQ
jgi:membrane-bound ClpP family serine protease